MLPLDTWRALLGFHPLHFWGMADGRARVTSACNGLVREYAWQNVDAVGRAEIREAIATAEAKLAAYLRYRVAPAYGEATVPWPRYLDASLMRTRPIDPTGRWLSVQLPEGQVQALGVESLTLIGTPAVVYTDTDGDGLIDTFTASIATTATDPAQIAVYVAAADRLDGDGLGARWRIQPITASISGGVVTVTGRAWLCVRPVRYAGLLAVPSSGAADTSGALDPDDASNFVAAVDIVRRATDPNGTTITTAQATITWETHPWGVQSWWCGCAGCTTPATAYGGSPFDPAATANAVGRAALRDAALGIVAPAESVYNASTGVWASLNWTVCTEPDRVTVRYLAGLPLDASGQMQQPWRVVVARLAAAELAAPICACDAANRELSRWQFDLARTSGAADEAYGAIAPADLDNPFGTRRGHVYAWRQVCKAQQLRGVLP